MEKLQRLSHLSVIFLGIVALFAVLSILKSITAPLFLAMVIGIVLAPVADFWERRGCSPATAALVNLLLALTFLGCLGLLFQPLLQQLVNQVPKVWSDLQGAIEVFRTFLRGVSDVAREVSDTVTAPAVAAPEATAPSEPGLRVETITDALLMAPAIAAQGMVFAGSLFFFQMTRAEIYAWVARYFSSPTSRGQTVQRLQAAERRVSRYFFTITLINAGLGLATGIALQLLGLPGAVLWGFMAFVLNFIPYLGPVVLVGALVFAGVATFDGVRSFLPALAFLGTNLIEGQFVTPALLGKSLALNPLLVFVALIFGIWLWGPIGGIVAVPMLVWVLVLNDMLRDTSPSAQTQTQAA